MCKNKLLSLWHRVRYKKHALLLALAAALTCGAVIGTLAWLTRSDETVNAFTVGHVSAEVEETFENLTKTDVRVKNTGDVPVYVRAYVSIYLQNADGTILSRVPEAGKDYTITWGAQTDWRQAGNIYYYCKPVPVNGETSVLIEQVTESAPDGELLVVEISTQTIQAEPADAVQDAWGAAVNGDGTLTPPGDAAP